MVRETQPKSPQRAKYWHFPSTVLRAVRRKQGVIGQVSRNGRSVSQGAVRKHLIVFPFCMTLSNHCGSSNQSRRALCGPWPTRPIEPSWTVSIRLARLLTSTYRLSEVQPAFRVAWRNTRLRTLFATASMGYLR